MESAEFSPLIVYSFAPPESSPHAPELSAEMLGGKAERGSCIINKGIDLNDVGDHGGSLGKLHGVDLNEGVNLVLHDEGLDLNKGIMEECSRVEKEMIDLNLDVREESENVSVERNAKTFDWNFDLNLELIEDNVRNLNDHEEELGDNGRLYAGGDKQMGKELVMDDNENLVNACGNKGKVISDITPKLIEVDAQTGNLILELESKEETQLEKARSYVDYDGVPESESRGRSRKRKETSHNDNTLATVDRELRSSRRAKRASFSVQDYAVNGAGNRNQLSSPVVNTVSGQMITSYGSAAFKESVLSSKVELPPSSGSMDLGGVSVFDLVSVYAFLRSFSTLLFLSPFELDDFVACVKCNDSTLLFDSIHVSLLRTLRKHLGSLSHDGSATASACLRSLNWDFLDLITWPVFVVEYLLLHSPGYIPGLDLHHFEPFQNDYYIMPASAKVGILQHICDDLIEIEAFRSELCIRTVMKEQPSRNMNTSCKRKKVAIDVANTSCITEEHIDESIDSNSDECCLCKMDGTLICCDGCPAAFHSRCVAVVSSHLPAGDWYCPECSFDKGKTLKMGKSIRGAELLGTDPHGRLYYSSCDCLLVLVSSNNEYSFRFYKRNDLPSLIEVLESSPLLYDKIISVICKHWNVTYGVDRMRNDINSRSYFMESAFPETRPLSIRNGAFAEKSPDDKSVQTTDSNNIETSPSGCIYVSLETGKDGVKMENQVASSEGSMEVSQAFTKTNIFKDGELDRSRKSTKISDNSQFPGDIVNSGDIRNEEGKNLSCGLVSQVSHGTQYVNFYEFARIASIVSEELISKSSDKSSENATRSVDMARQLRIISNRFSEFSWSNIQNLNVKFRKEKCGWCFYCKVPEDGKDCLFIMKQRFPAVENFTSEVLGIRSRGDRINHLIDVICHVICIEDHLQGLLVGSWLNPHYSQLWRKKILEADDLYSLKNMLLELESSLHHLALSADWRKHVDSAVTMGSASHIVRSTRVSLGLVISRKRKCSKQEIIPSSSAATGLSLFWWRGGRASRKLFNWKVLPRPLASKAGRQGGCRKILGVHYSDSGNCAKRKKYASWRAAVEASKGVEQLALQVRKLDANIRWDDIGNTNLLLKMGKESKRRARSFKNVTIRRKCHDGEVVRYLLDFGKRRPIPDIVLRHGSILEDSPCERKKYWLQESHVPLHLVKAFEEKRILRTSNKVICEETPETNKESRNLFKKKGFPYLFSRAERSEKYQQCNKDVLIRKEVSCQYCKGFSHKRHSRKSAASITAECMYTCHNCWDGKLLQIDARKDQSELPEHKKALKALKLCSGTKEEMVKEEQPVNSGTSASVPLVSPARRSARNVERILKLSLQLQNTKVKKRKRGTVNSSYWLNGLQFSRKTNDERRMRYRSNEWLVLSGEETTIKDKPKCSLCSELEYTSKLNYVACEVCGGWFHGDALDLIDDKIQKVIGFKCYKCLDKRPVVCPYRCPTGSNKATPVSRNSAD